MPRGIVEAREVVCRACAAPFVTDRAGKAAFYCRRPECDEQRKRNRVVVPNRHPSGTRLTPEEVAERLRRREQDQAERLAARQQAAAEREQAKRDAAEARAQAKAERRAAAVRAAEEARQARELAAQQERNRKAWEARDQRRAREAKQREAREAREVSHRAGIAARTAERLVPRVVKARAHAADLVAELRAQVDIVRSAGQEVPEPVLALAQPAAVASRPVAAATAEPAPRPSLAGGTRAPAGSVGPLAEHLAKLHRDVAAAHLHRAEAFSDDGLTFRHLLGRSIRKVGTATGTTGTADALYALAVVALAWESHLRRSAREVRQEQADAA